MHLSENIRIAIFSIRTNLMRSLLTMLGIIIGVSSVIAIIAVGNGGRDYIISMIEDMGSSTVSIMVNTGASTSEYISRDDIQAIKQLDEVSYVSPTVFAIGSCSSERVTGIALGLAGTADFKHIMNVNILHGRFFTNEEYMAGSRVCIIPSIGSESLFGYENCVGETVDFTLNGKTETLRVIGVSDMSMTGESADFSSMMTSFGGDQASAGSAVIMPTTVLDPLMGSDGYYDAIYIMAAEDSMLETVGNMVQNLLYARHGNYGSGAYTVTNMATFIDLLDSVIKILTTFIAGVSGISLVVGGIGVMNIMLVSVTERTREIGIRKALGAKTSIILIQFLTESVILCLIGGLIGLFLGIAGAAAVSAYMKIPIEVKFMTIAIAVGFSSAIGIFFGIYPAKRAAEMLPIEALRRD
ncbi:MAG: FtsX-like permease family protein [Clostridiales bacterium]|nr:FtsX-like permease family protein [Clostridiales bacterium]